MLREGSHPLHGSGRVGAVAGNTARQGGCAHTGPEPTDEALYGKWDDYRSELAASAPSLTGLAERLADAERERLARLARWQQPPTATRTNTKLGSR